MVLVVYFLPRGIVPAVAAAVAREMSVPVLRSARISSVRFGGLLAIADLSFEVSEGEVLSLIGPNGAGKTTAFNAITGYLAPAAGEIVFRRPQPERPEAAPDRRAGPGAHLPEDQRLRRPQRARQRPDRPAPARPGRRRSRSCSACRTWRAKSASCGRRRGGSSSSSAWLHGRASWRARCPTASSGCSKSRSRSPRSRSCCCSTSRYPA